MSVIQSKLPSYINNDLKTRPEGYSEPNNEITTKLLKDKLILFGINKGTSLFKILSDIDFYHKIKSSFDYMKILDELNIDERQNLRNLLNDLMNSQKELTNLTNVQQDLLKSILLRNNPKRLDIGKETNSILKYLNNFKLEIINHLKFKNQLKEEQ